MAPQGGKQGSDNNNAGKKKDRSLSPTKVRPKSPDQAALDAIEQEWLQYHEEGSPYNDNGEIMHRITLARKSTKLDLSKLGVSDPLPKEVYLIYYLKQLILESNCLLSISPLIGNPYLNGLMQLSLSNNCLRELPEQIGLLGSLKFLLVDDNQLLSVPSTICNLMLLSRLQLQRNNLADLPTSMAVMTWIQDLNVLENPFEGIPPEVAYARFKQHKCYSMAEVRDLMGKDTKISAATKMRLEEDVLQSHRLRVMGYLQKLHEVPETLKLDLSGYGICRIPPQVTENMTYLTELNLRDNKIASVPPSIRRLGASLVTLDLSYNRLSSLPMDLRFLTNVTDCRLEGMGMEFLPKEIRAAGVKNLLRYINMMNMAVTTGALTLDGMDLTDVPKDVLAMTNLTELNLDNNKIKALPGNITVLKGLKSISVNANLLRTIPAEIEGMDRLERISILDCPIEDLPLGLCHMTSLTEIRSYSHELMPRPPERVSTDTVIERTFNLLDSFEHMIKAFKTRRLDLSDMEMCFFPSEAFQISTLTELDICMNMFTGVPGSIGNLNNLLLLNLAFNYLEQVDFEWEKLTALERLLINNNCISHTLKPPFGGLRALRELMAHDNQFTTMPAEMCQMQSLIYCDLSFNAISSFPSFPTYSLPNLTHLDMRHNKMVEVPFGAFGHQSSLMFVDFSFNRIRSFPPGGDWPRLDDSLSAFEAKCIPLHVLVSEHYAGTQHIVDLSFADSHRPVLNWAGLKTLRLHHNEISVLPFEMWILTSVTDLSYDAPTVKIPTQEIVIQGWSMLRCYMRRWQDARSSWNLDISHFGLRLVPVELILASCMTRLDISHNRLSGSLDPQLSSLVNLTEMDVSHNRLVEIHPKLVALTRLTAHHVEAEGYFAERGGLRWHGNKWRSPPYPVRVQGTRRIFQYLSAFTEAFKTKVLHLTGTDLHHVPIEVLKLTQLTQLDISQGNQLLVLPPTLTVLQELESLLVDDNRLFYIHPELGKMAKLRQFSMKNNVLEVLPHELSAISTLKNLKYSGNPLTGPPEGTPVSIRSLGKIQEESPKSFEPWMDLVLEQAATDVPPEATLVYLQNWVRARGSIPMKVVGTNDLDLRALGLGHMPREVSDLEWSGRQHRHDAMTDLVHIRLDHNPIAELPSKIKAWWCVRTLTLNNCMLRVLPQAIGDVAQVPCLEHFEACDNGIRTMSVIPGTFTALRQLDLDRNDFTVLPPQIGWMSTLEVLSLRDNKILHIPTSVWRMRSLRILHLDRNKLQRICPEMGALPRAELFPARGEIEMEVHLAKGGPELDYVDRPPGSAIPMMPPDKRNLGQWRKHCSGLERDGESEYGRLAEFTFSDNPNTWSPPPEVMEKPLPHAMRFLRSLFDARHTHSLDLHGLGLKRLPPEALELGWTLRHLWISYNDLETLPICIEELSALQTLHLHHNRITRLPPTVGLCLTNLSNLDISSNAMTRIPLEFANLKNLQNFIVEDNPWDMIADETVGQGTKSLLRFLQAVKESIHGVLDVQDMGISSYGLTFVKRAIPDPGKIFEVNMDDNLIQAIPKSLHVLTAVVSLSMNNNKIREIPEWIAVYERMQVMMASHNHMTEIQETIGECLNLTKLHLDANFIKSIPNSFSQLTNLHTLRLDSNQLVVVNPCLGFCTALQKLSFELNELTCLPPELSYCTQMHELKLGGNALKTPPREAIVGGTHHIMSYLARLQIGKEKLDMQMPNLALVHVPFEITYMSNLTRLNLDDNRLRDLWPVAPLPPFTERDKAVIVGGGYWAYRLFPEDERRSWLWEEPEDGDRIIGPMDGLPTANIPEHPVHLLGNLVNLQSLSVRNNRIEDLPDKCFPRFQTSLRELYIDNNNIKVLPFGMHALDVLESFSLTGNPVGHPPVNYETEGFPTLRKYWKRIAAAELSGICELPKMSLNKFPPEFCIDDKLAHNVRYLDLSNNNIPRIDPLIYRMTTLEQLKLDGNQLREIPPKLFDCDCLIELSLDRNIIKELPSEVCKCTRLTLLSFCHNKLTRIPDEIEALTSLMSLQLSHNELVLGTAGWLAALTFLQTLGLDHNKMIAIPVTVGVLVNLDELKFEGNNLKDPPLNVLIGGIKSIRDYLYYNVAYEYGGSGLAPPRTRKRVAGSTVDELRLEDAALYKNATTNSTYNHHYTVAKALDGGLENNSFWRSADRDDNVVLDVDLGTKFAVQRIEIHWRSNFSPKRYTIEVSEEGRQWFLVHRCIVDPAKGEGDVVRPGEEHITRMHTGYGTDRKDVIILRRADAMMIDSVLPSTGIKFVRVHMTSRWFSGYRIAFLQVWADRIQGASQVSAKGHDVELAYRDA